MKILIILSALIMNFSFAEDFPDLDEKVTLENGHKVYKMGGLTKFHRITKNEKAIAVLMKEVQILKKEVQDLKKQMSASKGK